MERAARCGKFRPRFRLRKMWTQRETPFYFLQECGAGVEYEMGARNIAEILSSLEQPSEAPKNANFDQNYRGESFFKFLQFVVRTSESQDALKLGVKGIRRSTHHTQTNYVCCDTVAKV